jgi:predicted PurR-regulated permease PerM
MIPKNEPYTYPQKVWIAGSILSLIIIILLLLNETFSVLLLVLAGSLIAIFFRGLGSFIQKRTGWKNSITIILSVLINTVIIVALVWLVGAKVQSQVTSLNEALPSSIENARAQLNKSQLGQSLVKQISSPSSLQKARSIGSTFLKSSFGVFTDIYVVIFIGIFFTASPKLYINGIIQIVPVKGRDKAMEVLNKIGGNLKKWLLGKLFAMAVVFILTAVGLLIIGSPLWIALALIAGIFNFIPNFGPLIAMIPAVLIAIMQGPQTVMIVIALYIAIQVVESNFITPLAQQRLISIPPALIIIAQLLMGTLSGGWGVILATPLMVIVIVIVQELYIKKINGVD